MGFDPRNFGASGLRVSSEWGYMALQGLFRGDKDLLSFIIFLSCPVWVLVRGDYTVPWGQHTEDGKSD